ncbi:MAG: type 1 glutamine amidotransferase [Cytophagaceae bacterium]|nr:type 1 glutamine amidotransferase [Cytophagaceae bacterium]
MNIHYLQHEPFEDLAAIEKWAKQHAKNITCTKLYEKHTFPDPDSFDMLIIMGGAMGVYQEDIYPWLKEEKKYIKKAVEKNKKVLGICLGSQFLAEALGAKVYKNKEKEIGWFDIEFTGESKNDKYFSNFPSKLKVFHWHGDTFDLPEGARHIAFSKACKNQAFTYKENVVALQFHIEATKKSIDELAYNCGSELVEGNYIQKKEDIIKHSGQTEEMNRLMFSILDKMK